MDATETPIDTAGPFQIERARKRDGQLVAFDADRIAEAIFRAAREAGRPERSLADRIAAAAIVGLTAGRRAIVSVEDVQDAVELALMQDGLDEIARRYVLYRRRRAELRSAKRMLGVTDELKLSLNAVAVLRERYLRRGGGGGDRGGAGGGGGARGTDGGGGGGGGTGGGTGGRGGGEGRGESEIVESTGEMMDRVAAHVAAAEERFAAGSSARWREDFSRMLRGLELLPNSPTLMNAGTTMGLLSGCFVLPVEDSLSSIFEALKEMALIHQAGGGTGFSFSALRPRGDTVASTGGSASGPVPFMRIFDVATEVIRQGGRRRGANMAVLDVSHPDIEELIDAKTQEGSLSNFNLSVGVSEGFMRAASQGATHVLLHPRTGREVSRVPARELLRRIAAQAWRTGDPGLLFLDAINSANPVPSLGRIEATNPCGEVPLLPHESCNLGSINLARMVRADRLDWERLRATVALGVRFLDDVIEVNRYPTAEIARASRRTRKIGLGVMGLAETLALLGIPYDSEQGVALGGQIAATLRDAAETASERLATERGPFPAWRADAAGVAARPRRNAQLLSIAPTGTISIIAGTTSGIEPMFAISYLRRALGRQLTETNTAFEALARERGFYSEELMSDIARTGTLADRTEVPSEVRRAWVTALQIAPEWHLRMQAAFQEHCDGAVSKTVNLPQDATVDDVLGIYLSAWRSGVKGITVYRYGSRQDQALRLLSDASSGPRPPVGVHAEYAGGCAWRSCEF